MFNFKLCHLTVNFATMYFTAHSVGNKILCISFIDQVNRDRQPQNWLLLTAKAATKITTCRKHCEKEYD